MNSNRVSFDNYLKNKYKSYYKKFLKEYLKTIKNFSEKNVHNLRVSIRRLLAFLNLLSLLASSNYILFLKKKLKKLINSLNFLRDTQVQILKIKFEPIAYQENLLQILSENEKYYLGEAYSKLNKIQINKIEGGLFFLGLELQNLNTKDLTKVKIKNILNESYQNVLNKIEKIDINKQETFHQLRLALKKYRYLAEIFAPYLRISKSKILQFKKQQDILGEIQDNNVFKELIENLYKQNKIDINIKKLYLEFLEKRNQEIVNEISNSIIQIKKLNFKK